MQNPKSDAACRELRTKGVRFSFQLEGKAEEVSPAVLLGLYNIGREAIANAFRHAGATKVNLSFTCGRQSVVMSISDDGHGFNTDAQENNPRTGTLGSPRYGAACQGLGSTVRLSERTGPRYRHRRHCPTEARQRKSLKDEVALPRAVNFDVSCVIRATSCIKKTVAALTVS